MDVSQKDERTSTTSDDEPQSLIVSLASQISARMLLGQRSFGSIFRLRRKL